uniref:Thaumatin pathogenesis-related protein n=1 Tax=Cyanothece sp. (strain PCC 7425 / ATCC 29141) TaxID=395961 RepID=B8HN72_CYAP4
MIKSLRQFWEKRRLSPLFAAFCIALVSMLALVSLGGELHQPPKAMAQQTGQRVFIVKNSCSQDIWIGAAASQGPNPGIIPQWISPQTLKKGLSLPGSNTGRKGWLSSNRRVRLSPTDWYLKSGATGQVVIPNTQWISGTIWARTGCSPNTQPWGRGQAVCRTGDCGGQQACQGFSPANGTTLAEFNLFNGTNQGGQNPQLFKQDFYDVSNVDGFNVPVQITPQGTVAGVATQPAYLNCKAQPSTGAPPPGIAGSCYGTLRKAGVMGWDQLFLENCPARNQIYGYALGGLAKNCPPQTTLAGTTGLCISNSTTGPSQMQPFNSLCLSDNKLSSYLPEQRGNPPPVAWPPYSDNPKYGCPFPPYTKENCPADYRVPPGQSPYNIWPTYFVKSCKVSAYGYVYDDQANSYQCQTYGQGLNGSYLVELCPGDNPSPTLRRRSFGKF